MVDSNLLDANIDEILCPGEADADFKLENIDADAILGDDEHALDDGHKEKVVEILVDGIIERINDVVFRHDKARMLPIQRMNHRRKSRRPPKSLTSKSS